MRTHKKPGGEREREEGASSLLSLSNRIDTDRTFSPSFLAVITGIGDFAYRRKERVYVIPIGSLKN